MTLQGIWPFGVETSRYLMTHKCRVEKGGYSVMGASPLAVFFSCSVMSVSEFLRKGNRVGLVLCCDIPVVQDLF